MTRPSSDLAGVTWEGQAGVYTVRLHGRIIGTVVSSRRRHGVWRAFPVTGGFGHWWSGVNRGEAVTPLIAWHQAGRP